MVDIQNEVDTREVPLKKVGVRNVKYPVTVLDKNNKVQSTTATVDLFVNLPHHFKGTHMSRFIEVFHKYHTDISMQHFLDMLEEIRVKLDAEKPMVQLSFLIILKRKLLFLNLRELWNIIVLMKEKLKQRHVSFMFL